MKRKFNGLNTITSKPRFTKPNRTQDPYPTIAPTPFTTSTSYFLPTPTTPKTLPTAPTHSPTPPLPLNPSSTPPQAQPPTHPNRREIENRPWDTVGKSLGPGTRGSLLVSMNSPSLNPSGIREAESSTASPSYPTQYFMALPILGDQTTFVYRQPPLPP
ncbi:hypothetical protein NMY22_g8736 [Coprinellus aureogranulatus]|nr:hypothetical protein NMY22_g8736 [Coprinellus aureogranulatus]